MAADTEITILAAILNDINEIFKPNNSDSALLEGGASGDKAFLEVLSKINGYGPPMDSI